jgi:hypothetical protein
MLRLQVVSSDGKAVEWSASAEEWQGCCAESRYLSARESFASGLQAGDQEDASVQISAGWCTMYQVPQRGLETFLLHV